MSNNEIMIDTLSLNNGNIPLNIIESSFINTIPIIKIDNSDNSNMTDKLINIVLQSCSLDDIKIFHKKMGDIFIEYINQLRIIKTMIGRLYNDESNNIILYLLELKREEFPTYESILSYACEFCNEEIIRFLYYNGAPNTRPIYKNLKPNLRPFYPMIALMRSRHRKNLDLIRLFNTFPCEDGFLPDLIYYCLEYHIPILIECLNRCHITVRETERMLLLYSDFSAKDKELIINSVKERVRRERRGFFKFIN